MDENTTNMLRLFRDTLYKCHQERKVQKICYIPAGRCSTNEAEKAEKPTGHQNGGQNHNIISRKYTGVKNYLGATLTNQNYGEVKIKSNSGNACKYSGQNFPAFHLHFLLGLYGLGIMTCPNSE
jgi:hypothetical protein